MLRIAAHSPVVKRDTQRVEGNGSDEDDQLDSNARSLVTTGLQLTQRGAYASAAVVQFATGSSE
jgi:hypothetical protein